MPDQIAGEPLEAQPDEAPEAAVTAEAVDSPEQAEGEVPESEASPQDPRVQKANREAQALRKRLRETEAKLAEREQAEMSEIERQAARVQALEAELSESKSRAREASLRASVVDACRPLNIVDPEAALALLDRDAIDFDEDLGRWTGVEQALSALAESKPYLVEKNSAGGHPTNPARTRGPNFTIEQIRSMGDAEMQALSEEEFAAVQRVVAENS